MEAKEDFRKYTCLNNEKRRRIYTHSDEVDIEPIKSIWLIAIKVQKQSRMKVYLHADGNVSTDSFRGSVDKDALFYNTFHSLGSILWYAYRTTYHSCLHPGTLL